MSMCIAAVGRSAEAEEGEHADLDAPAGVVAEVDA